jgi:hypothetical protein
MRHGRTIPLLKQKKSWNGVKTPKLLREPKLSKFVSLLEKVWHVCYFWDVEGAIHVKFMLN